MKMRRFCACIMALLLAASMPLTAVAEEYDLNVGSVEVTAGEVGQTVSQVNGVQNHTETRPTVIQQTGGGSTSNTVTINAGAGSTANVTLDGVNINSDGAAILTLGGGNVTIELDGENQVQSGYQHAGVEKQNSGKLTITDEDGGGSLTANGGDGGAGIGGKIESSASDITISDGKVTATGGEGGAGIGGGAQGGTGSNITISDGTVNATGVEGGAGIGGGASGAGSGITIKGGTVDANGGTDAAGIGGGTHGNGSNITISGGTVNATGGNPPIIGSGDALEFGEGGGAGIGGGANDTGDNIAIKNNAQVTATGQGNAANIGNGYSSEAKEKQKDKVDLSGLSQFGKVNGVSGSNGSNLGEGSSSGSTGGNPGGSSGTPKTVASYKTWSAAAADLGGLKVSDNDGNEMSDVVWLKADSELEITAKEEKVLVSGNKADLLQLTVEGVKQINLETNRVNVSVSNEVLNKITGTGGSFQLSTDDTTVNLTATDQNNKKTLDMTLSANKQSGTQAAPSQSSKKPEISIDAQSNTGNNSEGGTLQVSTNASEATLSLDQKYLQTLMNSEFSKLALAVGNLITTVDSMLAANTAVNGSGSISIGDNTVNMNGIQISANNSSGNSQLSQRIDEIMFQLRNQSQSGSAMMVTVNEKVAMASASLKVPGSALQSLMDQGVEKTVVSVNGETTSFQNGDMLKQIQDSQKGSALVCLKPSAIGEVDAGVGMFDKGAITYQFAD